MKIDKLNLIVDGQRGDGGDSCNFTCTFFWLVRGQEGPFKKEISRITCLFWGFFDSDGPVRHPHQVPWNNPKNFSRDQAIPLIAISSKGLARHFFWKTIRNFGFMPNSERDYPGTTKYPWPHKVNGKWRMFDFADPVGFDFAGMMILRGRMWYLYWLLPLGYLQTWLSIIFFCSKACADKEHTDFKQLYILASHYGLDRFFYNLYPWGLEYASEKYFCGWRDLEPIHNLFLHEFKDQHGGELK